MPLLCQKYPDPFVSQPRNPRPLSSIQSRTQTIIVDPPYRPSRTRPVSMISPPTVRIIAPDENYSDDTYVYPASNRKVRYREESLRPIQQEDPFVYDPELDEIEDYYQPYKPRMMEQEIVIPPPNSRTRSRSRGTVSSRRRSISVQSSTKTTASIPTSGSSVVSTSPSHSRPRTPDLSNSRSTTPTSSPRSQRSSPRYPYQPGSQAARQVSSLSYMSLDLLTILQLNWIGVSISSCTSRP